ncbi:hypothetical protein EDD17DRAFT_293802 [Pisolithus thermaeus]|nr:hypothetical protein EDD17DRAFT_293802 [Pisolithus thermaeus]
MLQPSVPPISAKKRPEGLWPVDSLVGGFVGASLVWAFGLMGRGRHECRLVFVMVASLVIWAIATCRTLLPSVFVSLVPFLLFGTE